jgi:hypothetical protein
MNSPQKTVSRRTFAKYWALGIASALISVPHITWANAPENEGFDEDSILKAASDFLGDTTEGLGKVIAKAFKEQGRPSGYIKGEEVAGAATIGLRYGEGQLAFKHGGGSRIFWQGPSIGFDLGGNASKVFVLVYHAHKTEDLLKRFPSVDGSVYYVGGAGVNYQQRDDTILAPIRLGVGLRAGASIGYTHYTLTKTLNPL